MRSVFVRVGLLVTLTAIFFGSSISAAGQKEWLVHSFDGTHGDQPMGNLIADSAGNLYGTAFQGGAHNWGVVYELVRPVPPKTAWTETVLYSFCSVGAACSDGSHPVAELITDDAGALYGTTVYGGSEDSGAVFKLTPPAKGQTAWTESVLKSFCETTVCLDGSYPQAGLVFGPQGALYGTTYNGGFGGNGYGYSGGVVFKLTRPGKYWSPPQPKSTERDCGPREKDIWGCTAKMPPQRCWRVIKQRFPTSI